MLHWIVSPALSGTNPKAAIYSAEEPQWASPEATGEWAARAGHTQLKDWQSAGGNSVSWALCL